MEVSYSRLLLCLRTDHEVGKPDSMFSLWKTIWREKMTYSVAEIRRQILDHLNQLKQRFDELIVAGMIPIEWEVFTLAMNGTLRRRKNSCWIKEQIDFCQRELEEWSKIMV